MKTQRSEHLSVEWFDYEIEMEMKQREEGDEASPGEKRWTESDQTELTTRPTGTLSVHLN